MISLVLYGCMALAAALWIGEHFALAWRARRRRAPWALSLTMPAWAAWQAGDHGAAVRYWVWAGSYIALAISARALAVP